MADPRPDLPEGTDKIVPGAMDTNRDGLDNSGVIATPAASGDSRSSASSGAGSAGAGSAVAGASGGRRRSGGGSAGGGSGGGSDGRGSGSGGSSGAIMDKVRSGSEKLSGQAADKARDFVGQGIDRSAEALTNVSKLVGDTASGIDERLGPEYGDYARRAAETLESTANRLSTKNPDELIDDTRNFIRKSPGVALAGAAIVGFALARLVKSGLSGETDRSGEGSQPGEPGPSGGPTGSSSGTSGTGPRSRI